MPCQPVTGNRPTEIERSHPRLLPTDPQCIPPALKNIAWMTACS